MERRVGVAGLGYVGLPLLDLLATKFQVLGFDIDAGKIAQLKAKKSYIEDVAVVPEAIYTSDPADLKKCHTIFVCVPTPSKNYQPDLKYIISVSELLGEHIAAGTVVCYESTVLPGTTERCAAILAENSKLTLNKDFFVAYSPERINPGDKVRTIGTIKKLIGSATPEGRDAVAAIYNQVIEAGVHLCPSAEVAELAKLFENVQRATNITLSTELSHICRRIGLDVHDVLDACSTKWNFMNVRPGGLQGHCLPENIVYFNRLSPQSHITKAVHEANGELPREIAWEIYTKLFKSMPEDVMPGAELQDKTIAMLGVAYKEDLGDYRNTLVPELGKNLFGAWVYYQDPHVDPLAFKKEYGVKLETSLDDLPPRLDAIVIAVKHKQYLEVGLAAIAAKLKPGGWIFDLKKAFTAAECHALGVYHWSL